MLDLQSVIFLILFCMLWYRLLYKNCSLLLDYKRSTISTRNSVVTIVNFRINSYAALATTFLVTLILSSNLVQTVHQVSNKRTMTPKNGNLYYEQVLYQAFLINSPFVSMSNSSWLNQSKSYYFHMWKHCSQNQ